METIAKRKKYEKALQQDAVRKMETRGELPLIQLSKQLGVTSGQLYEWREKLGYQIAGSNQKSLEQEVKRLRRENSRLQEEREILKKATAFFAKEGS